MLNGTRVPNLLRFKTLAAKIAGTIVVVSVSMPLGKEGPMVQIGAMVAMQLVPLFRLEEIRLPSKEREWIGMGAAAGVAAAFSAPLGGILYSFEEASPTQSKHPIRSRIPHPPGPAFFSSSQPALAQPTAHRPPPTAHSSPHVQSMLKSQPTRARCVLGGVFAGLAALLTIAHAIMFLASLSLLSIPLAKWYVESDEGDRLTFHGFIAAGTSLFASPAADKIEGQVTKLQRGFVDNPSGIVLMGVWMLYLLCTVMVDLVVVYKCFRAQQAIAALKGMEISPTHYATKQTLGSFLCRDQADIFSATSTAMPGQLNQMSSFPGGGSISSSRCSPPPPTQAMRKASSVSSFHSTVSCSDV